MNSFETKDIAAFYEEYETGIKQTTVNWRVYTLIQRGILNRIGRGRFILGTSKLFIPEISLEMKAINKKLNQEFPYLKTCIWNTSVLNEFMHHQLGRFYLLIEVEKVATQSVFYFLKEAKKSVFIEPTSDILEKYLPREKEALIVKPLVSEAPIQIVEGIHTASLEKMLVDIFCDKVLFSNQQGAEMRTVFREALHKYSVNQSRMLRYADRRRKKKSFNKYLISITNLRQQ
ncbi:MAG: hypothetical protein HQ510_01095 [Candidatus Marinimicrobia bacterium]|nr:hypothetical protein [Candidatus Neomarinimicrobiota bacterium]